MRTTGIRTSRDRTSGGPPVLPTYFWASAVFKNQSFKSQLFSSSQKKIPQIEIMA